MGLFSRKPSAAARLADAVAADAGEAFARFVAERGDDSIVALAFCSIDDAATPYINPVAAGFAREDATIEARLNWINECP